MSLRKITPYLAQRMQRGRGNAGAGANLAANLVAVIRAVKVAPSATDVLSAVLAEEAASIDQRLGHRARMIQRNTQGVQHLDGVGYVDGCAACFTLASQLEAEALQHDAGRPDTRATPGASCATCGARWQVQRSVEIATPI